MKKQEKPTIGELEILYKDFVNSINFQVYGDSKPVKFVRLNRVKWFLDDLRYKLARFIAGDLF